MTEITWTFCLVGVAGFEPTTTTPPVWCATKLRYTPKTCIELFLPGLLLILICYRLSIDYLSYRLSTEYQDR